MTTVPKVIIFLTGFGLAMILWPLINLPFVNPYGVTGSYTVIEMNPNTEILRFLIVLGLPVFMLLIYHKFVPKAQSDIPRPLPENGDSLSGIWPVALILFSVIYALNIGIEKYLFDYFHDGESLGPAISYYADQIPYKDYLFLHGFFQDPLRSVLAFELFGVGISSYEIMDTILKIINSGLLFFLIYRLFRFNRLALAGVVIAIVILGISNRVWTRLLYEIVPVINHQGRDICTFSFLIVLTYLYEAVKSEKTGSGKVFWLSFLWFLIAIGSYLYSVDRAYYLSAASLILGFLFLIFIIEKRKRLVFFAGSFLGIITGCVAFVIVIGEGVPYFMGYYFAKLPAFKELVDGLPYDISEPPFMITLLLISSSVYWLANRFFAEGIFHSGRKINNVKHFVRTYFPEIALSLLVIFFFRSALGRSDYYHIAYVSVLIYLLLFLLLFKRILRPWLDELAAKHWIKKAFPIGFLSIFLLGFLRLFANDQYLLKANFPFGVPDAVYLDEDYIETVGVINRELDENENFYTLTNELCWYYFIDKPCPSRHHLINFASPEIFQEELIDDLKSSNVELILYNNEDPFNHFDNVGFRERVPLVTEYVHENYEFFKKIGRQELWRRKK